MFARIKFRFSFAVRFQACSFCFEVCGVLADAIAFRFYHLGHPLGKTSAQPINVEPAVDVLGYPFHP